MSEISKLLSDGLESGYGGNTEREIVQRGPFKIEASQLQTQDGKVYRDEWIADRTGGGQEIAQAGESTSTRLYGGGTIGLEQLRELGLTKKDVTSYLKKKVKELGQKTRLFNSYIPDSDSIDSDYLHWQYSYNILENMENIPLTIGLEKIHYKGNLVFAHAFILTTVE